MNKLVVEFNVETLAEESLVTEIVQFSVQDDLTSAQEVEFVEEMYEVWLNKNTKRYWSIKDG